MIKYQGISTLEVLTEAKNYNKWIADEIWQYINSPALEIGAGTGNLSVYFLNKKPLYITDKDNGLVKQLKKRFGKEKNLFINSQDITKKPQKKVTNFFKTIFAVNVLEHIEDDEEALKNIYPMLKKNGRLILLVPAKRFAYTQLDKQLGHYRRYEKDELIKKLTAADYKIEHIKFFNIVGLISWYVRNRINRGNINLKPYHIKLFDMIVPILRAIESIIAIPVGISLIVVARKK